MSLIKINNKIAHVGIDSKIVTHTNFNKFIAFGEYDGANASHIMWSNDDGINWNYLDTQTEWDNNSIGYVRIVPLLTNLRNSNLIVFLAYDVNSSMNMFIYSEDNCKTWKKTHYMPGGPSNNNIALYGDMSENGLIIRFGTYQRPGYISNAGIDNIQYIDNSEGGLSYAMSIDGQIMYKSEWNSYNFSKSTNYGNAWQVLSNHPSAYRGRWVQTDNTGQYVIDARDNTYSDKDGASYSKDYGESWTTPYTGKADSFLSFDASVIAYVKYEGYVYISENYGNSFTEYQIPGTPNSKYYFRGNRNTNKILIWGYDNKKIYYWEPGASTITEILTSTPDALTISELGLTRNNTFILITRGVSNPGSIFRSTEPLTIGHIPTMQNMGTPQYYRPCQYCV